MFQECFKSVSRVFQECLKFFSRVFLGCVKGVSRVCQWGGSLEIILLNLLLESGYD